jgi:hypothetical protein
LTSADGIGLRVGQTVSSALGSTAGGVQRINIGAGASDTEMTHAIYAAAFANNVATDDPAKDAARAAAMKSSERGPHGFLENVCANWLSNTGSSWSKTSLAKQRFQQTMFEEAVRGSQAFVSRQQGNAYTEYLRGLYGEWGDVQDAEAVHLISNPDSSESPWNRNIGPATDALVASGIPIDKDTRAAMQNLSIQSMHPARRKQAVFAALSYTYREAKLLHGHHDMPVFKLAHGEMARALSADEVNNALAIFQLSGQEDLCSSLSPTFISATSAAATAAQSDFGATYARMASTAPTVARSLGYIEPEVQLTSIKSYCDLARNVIPKPNESLQEAMQQILVRTGSVIVEDPLVPTRSPHPHSSSFITLAGIPSTPLPPLVR